MTMVKTASTERGFTLIELMIGVMIVAILAAVAFPSYQESLRRGYERQAQADLQALAQSLERTFSTSLSYASRDGETATSPPGKTGTEVRYDLSVEAAANTFTVTATPKETGVTAGSDVLTINHLGARSWE